MLQLSIGIPLRGTNSKYSKVSDFYIVIIHWNPFKRYQFKIFENIPEFCSIRLRSKQIEYEIFITRTLNKVKSFFNRTDSCYTRFAYFLLDIRNRNECFSPIDTC